MIFPENEITEIIAVIVAFGIIVTASNHLAKIFQNIKLPLITGFIIVGIFSGPYLLKMLPGNLNRLGFINDISLAFIAFASGTEIYLKEIRDKVRDITVMTTAQLVIIFVLGFTIILLLADYIPFMSGAGQNTKTAVSLLISTIFIASSPASAIAVINELRARGRFTKTALGVTVIKDIFVIILFAVTFAVAEVLVSGNKFNISEIIIVFADLLFSVLIGIVYGKILELNFKIAKNEYIDISIILLIGWSMFLLSSFITKITSSFLTIPLHLEALLIGIVAGFYVTNYTDYRTNLEKLTNHFGHYVYAAFFTLIGATLSVDLLIKYWTAAILLFGIRILTVFGASFVGSLILKEKIKEAFLSWMPYVTQAGISLGLITIISAHFLDFGTEFEAVMIAVIVINQFTGPPLMKFSIIKRGEAHIKSKDYSFDFHKDVFIIGLGGKAVLLAKTLKREGYSVKVISDRKDVDASFCTDVEVNLVDNIDYETLVSYNFKDAESVVIMRDEDPAYEISELIYEKFGTPNVIVVLETRGNIKRFKEIGVIVVAPTAALIALLEHFVRSPHATSILLGMQENQETEEIEVLADDIHGMLLKDLRLPIGVLVVSVTRNNQVMLPSGYTRLRKHDTVAVVGSQEQIDIVRTKLQY
ncbi:MAG: hypothetical protein GXO50_04060 [Chlorobi bacterium]|nr:hypothetical protein [Chlorobiota bacterium]